MSFSLQSLLPKQQESELNSTALFLSLYLVLLAFFILLNSISHPDGKKTGEVVSSVNIAFEANHDEQNFIIKKSVEVPVGDDIQLGGYLAALEEVVAKEVQLVSVDNSQGNVMQAIFPIAAFFASKKAYILPNKQPFMTEMAKTLKEDISVEIVLTTESYDDSKLAISRLATLATRLETLGVDDGNIHVGVIPSSKEQIQLSFVVISGEDGNGK